MAKNNKTKAEAPVAEANQTDTVEGVLAETVVAEDSTVIEAGTEVLVDASELTAEEVVEAEATTPAEVVEEAAPEAPVEDPAPAEFIEAEVTEPVLEAVVEAPVAAVAVSHNSTFLVWPTDVWGFTAALKEALIMAASRINGAADKKALVDAVLATGLAHIEAKYAVDAQIRQAAIDAAIAQNEAKETVAEAPAQAELF